MFRKMRKFVSIIIMAVFSATSIKTSGYAQLVPNEQIPWMPKPGVMMHLSPEFTPAHLEGIVIHPENALKFDFIVYKGDQEISGQQKKEEYTKLIKYFLASLAVPDEDQWVNLSPYEKDRIIKEDFGKTEMGHDLLAQDYILKQITASLIYPQDRLGRKFWDKVYAKAQEQYGTTNVPVNTFNKVWIVPDSAELFEKGNAVFLISSHLKVVMEEDYLSLQKHAGIQHPDASRITADNKAHSVASKIAKEIIIPEIEKEVNLDKNFANLRQAYSGMILAAWYKRALKESLLGKIYANKDKVKGVDQDPRINEVIYRQYLRAYKKGVFNFIKEDVNKYTNETIPRKYFSGGVTAGRFDTYAHMDDAMVGIPASERILNKDEDVLWEGQEALGPHSYRQDAEQAAERTKSILLSTIGVRADSAMTGKERNKSLDATVSSDTKHLNALISKEEFNGFPKKGYEFISEDKKFYVSMEVQYPGVVLLKMVKKGFTKIKGSRELAIVNKEGQIKKAVELKSTVTEGQYRADFEVNDYGEGLHFVLIDKKWPLSPRDKAMTVQIAMQQGSFNSDWKRGGIDFNTANLNLQIKRDGKGVPLPISQQNLENIHIDGLIPVILDIKPATALPLLAQLQSSRVQEPAKI